MKIITQTRIGHPNKHVTLEFSFTWNAGFVISSLQSAPQLNSLHSFTVVKGCLFRSTVLLLAATNPDLLDSPRFPSKRHNKEDYILYAIHIEVDTRRNLKSHRSRFQASELLCFRQVIQISTQCEYITHEFTVL